MMPYQRNLSYRIVSNSAIITRLISKNSVAIFHTLPTLVIFYPVLLGKIFVPGTDLYFSHFPNLLFGNISQKLFGQPSTWNPFIFSGLNMNESMHSHSQVIFLEPLRFLSNENALWTLGLIAMINCILIGILWNKIANTLNVKNSFLIGFVAQFGMYFWFTTTTFIGTFMYVGMSLGLYSILSWANRTTTTNTFYLSTCFVLILSFPHPVYIIGNLIPILVTGILYVRKSGIKTKASAHFTAILIGSMTIALLLNIQRYVSVISGLLNGTAINSSIPTQGNRIYFGLTTINPTNFGINIGDSLRISGALGFPGSHLQAHVGLYFGVIPLLLVLYSFLTHKEIKMKITATLFAFFWLADLYGFQPFSDMFSILLPGMGTHPGVMKPVLNWLFLILLCFSLNNIEKTELSITPKFHKYVLASMSVYFTLEILLVTKISSDQEFSKIFGESIFTTLLLNAALILALLIFLLILLDKRNRLIVLFQNRKTMHVTGLILVATSSAVLILLRNTLTLNVKVLLLNLMLMPITFGIYGYYEKQKYKQLILSLLAFVGFIFAFNSRKLPDLPQSFNQDSVIGLLSGTLLLIFQILVFYSIASQKTENTNTKFRKFTILTLISLLSFTSVYMYSSTYNGSPYGKYHEFYPQSKILNTDSKNYRFNRITQLNNIQGNELQASFAITLQQPTFGGVDSSFDVRYLNFIDYLNQPAPSITSRAGILSDIQSSRAMDLLGVAYDVDENGDLIFRTTALTRFSSYSKYELLSEEKTLERLMNPSFDPNQAIIFSEENLNLTADGSNSSRKKLAYSEKSFDHLVVNVSEQSSRFVLFNERIDKGWRAFWNEKEIEIHEANYTKMAVVLPPGKGTLKLLFESSSSGLLQSMRPIGGVLMLWLFVQSVIQRLRTKGRDHSRRKRIKSLKDGSRMDDARARK